VRGVPAAQLNHTIVAATDKRRSAEFLCRVLGLPAPVPAAHFLVVELANGVSLDYDDAAQVAPQHYAFLVAHDDFGPILDRVRAEGVATFADPGHGVPGTNDRGGGRGFYFSDPDGHNLEVLTHP
jgi:catechol 2,3-dioxygenase-like lactoylglutathione lyase family enzyme